IIVPLSYGNSHYREKIIEEGRRIFGDRFIPVIDFLSLEEYIDLLRSCSTVIMNHLRQQAAGNLYISLYLGARVYLDPANPLYDEFRSNGLSVYKLNEISANSLRQELNTEWITKHRKILKESRGRGAHERNTQNMVTELSK